MKQDFYDERIHTARKPHRCYVCGKGISSGERYATVSQVYDGNFSSDNLCPFCMSLIHTMFHLGDFEEGMDYWSVREYASEFITNCTTREEGRAELMGEWRKQLRLITRSKKSTVAA